MSSPRRKALMCLRLSSSNAPLSHVPGVSTTLSTVDGLRIAPASSSMATGSPGTMGSSSASKVAHRTLHLSVTDFKERRATKASLPRSELPVALFPLPVWPTRTTLSLVGAIVCGTARQSLEGACETEGAGRPET